MNKRVDQNFVLTELNELLEMRDIDSLEVPKALETCTKNLINYIKKARIGTKERNCVIGYGEFGDIEYIEEQGTFGKGPTFNSFITKNTIWYTEEEAKDCLLELEDSGYKDLFIWKILKVN